jgi:threonine dehydrogenase-like Zn-dependent dehydrogenase
MAEQSLTAVVTDKRKIEMRYFNVPEPSGADGILRVELCGICGSDYHYYTEGHHWPYQLPPQVLGHEVVGRIDSISQEAAAHWKVKEGDLVIVESAITCHRCRYCVTGNSSLCSQKRSYGMSASMNEPPFLWGGYSQYMYLHPDAILHVVPPGVSEHEAVLFSPLANGVKWAQRVPSLSLGDSIVILGPGQQGLGCVLASSLAGANPIIVAGLQHDAKRLEVAKTLGATHTIFSDRGSLLEQVKQILGPDLADVVIDVTGSTAAQEVAVDLVRRGGTVVLGGRTPNKTVSFVMDKLTSRGIKMVGVRAHESEDVRKALAVISARRDQLSNLLTHEVSLKQADLALRLIGQEVPGEEAIHVAINPWLD